MITCISCGGFISHDSSNRDYILDAGKLAHFSDCAVHNEPAYPNELCDCGAVKAHKRWWTYLCHLSCIRYARLRSVLRSRLRTLFGLPSSVSNRAPYQNERFRPFDSNGVPHGLPERVMRAEREKDIRITARLGSISVNYPDPGNDKVSLNARVLWEVWSNQDISADRLALNLMYTYKGHWWQFWRETSVPQVGIPPNGQETTQYRKTYYANQLQPNRDEAVFEYVGDRKKASKANWALELVLIMGMPVGEHRIPVFTDWDEIRKRGTNPPL